MADRISKTQRWLDVIAYLLGRRLPVTVEEIMQAVPAYAATAREGDFTAMASARRMFERDKDELRKMGIPLETREYSVDGLEQLGYSLARRDFYLPYLGILSGAGTGMPRAGAPDVPLSPEEAGLRLRRRSAGRGDPGLPARAGGAQCLPEARLRSRRGAARESGRAAGGSPGNG